MYSYFLEKYLTFINDRICCLINLSIFCEIKLKSFFQNKYNQHCLNIITIENKFQAYSNIEYKIIQNTFNLLSLYIYDRNNI